MSGVLLPSATCHGRGLLLLCFNPARAGCCCESVSAQRCKVQLMGLAARYARLIGASSRTWVGFHLHQSRLAETRNQSDVIQGRNCDENDTRFFSLPTFLGERGVIFHEEKIWMGQVFMNGCEEEREHTRRVSLMRVGEAAAASLSSEHRGSRWRRPHKQTNKDSNEWMNEWITALGITHADTYTRRHALKCWSFGSDVTAGVVLRR